MYVCKVVRIGLPDQRVIKPSWMEVRKFFRAVKKERTATHFFVSSTINPKFVSEIDILPQNKRLIF